jgi:phosphopantothenoylcysteine decarboxylase/phosphopantothenate--cysteine ligase
MSAQQPNSLTLKGREIILAVCGGIAAYKSADLCSKLVQLGAGVTVVMTESAQKFIAPLTFEALSARPVRTDAFDLQDSSDPQHIGLTERADLLLIAPATADIIARTAHGLCDDLLSTMICAAACPVVFAPAMNNRMWDNPITQENCQKLQKLGYRFIGPASGWLACRNVGAGRLTEPSSIVDEVVELLGEVTVKSKPLITPAPKR